MTQTPRRPSDPKTTPQLAEIVCFPGCEPLPDPALQLCILRGLVSDPAASYWEAMGITAAQVANFRSDARPTFNTGAKYPCVHYAGVWQLFGRELEIFRLAAQRKSIAGIAADLSAATGHQVTEAQATAVRELASHVLQLWRQQTGQSVRPSRPRSAS